MSGGAGRRRRRSGLAALAGDLEPLAAKFFVWFLRAGDYNGGARSGTAVQLASLLRYAIGVVPLDALPDRFGKSGYAEHRRRGTHRRAHEGDRGAHAPGRCHQAPERKTVPSASPGRREAAAVPLVREVLARDTARNSPDIPATCDNSLRSTAAVEAVVRLDAVPDRRESGARTSMIPCRRSGRHSARASFFVFAPTATRCCVLVNLFIMFPFVATEREVRSCSSRRTKATLIEVARYARTGFASVREGMSRF